MHNANQMTRMESLINIVVLDAEHQFFKVFSSSKRVRLMINNKFLMCFDDEQKVSMMRKTFELKKNMLESLKLWNKAAEPTHVR